MKDYSAIAPAPPLPPPKLKNPVTRLPAAIVGFRFDVAGRVSYDGSGLETVREVVRDRAAREVPSRDSFSVKEDVLRFEVPAQVRFGDYSGRHGPVNCICCGV
jgi:hypothetical protein